MQYGHRGTEPALLTTLYIHLPLPLLLLFVRAKNIIKRLRGVYTVHWALARIVLK